MNTSKLSRTHTDYGSGSGTIWFDGDVFRVVKWRHEGSRRKTVIEYKFKVDGKPNVRNIAFDGYVNFKSDQDCLEQYEMFEIQQMFEIQHELGKLAGRYEKNE